LLPRRPPLATISPSLLIILSGSRRDQKPPNSCPQGAQSTREHAGDAPNSWGRRMDLHRNGTNGSCSSPCGPLTDYYIPDYILKPDSEQIILDNAPCCPVVVFINSRSGGQLGSSLIKTYRELLNEAQVKRLAVWKTCNMNVLWIMFSLLDPLKFFIGFWSLRRGSW
jgi:hypothetical protein